MFKSALFGQNATRERIQTNYGKERKKKIEGLDFLVQLEKKPNQEELSERGIMFYHYHTKRKKIGILRKLPKHYNRRDFL